MEIDDLIDETIKLSLRYNDQFMPFARALRRVKETVPWHFERVIRDCHISPRKMYYLLEIEAAFAGLGIPDQRLHDIGWTRLAVIAKLVTKANVEDALRLAESKPTHKLKTLVRGVIPAEEQHCMLLRLTADQYRLLANTLIQFGAERTSRGMSGKEDALIALVDSYHHVFEMLRKSMGKKVE